MTKNRFFQEADLPLEVVILLIVGLMMLITGILLFPVATGLLPYYENGVYGLMLVMFSLQIISMGKTPFGDMRRSNIILAAGIVMASLGVVACFIPDILRQVPRVLLFICFGPGGLILLLQMVFSRNKLRAWLSYGGIFRHLILGCTGVYIVSIVIGLLILEQRLLTTEMTAGVILLFGGLIVYLAMILKKIYQKYPEGQSHPEGEAALSTDKAMILVMCIFMVLLGILLIPVNLGLLPFSGSAQLGLLMVMFAVQMLALGSTPIGPFPRNRLMVIFGLLFAGLGIISIVVPGILVRQLIVLVGVLNIAGGVVSLGKIIMARFMSSQESVEPVPPILVRLIATQIVMNLLSILFGTSMLVSYLIPGLLIGLILFANGCALLYLLSILIQIEKLQSQAEAAAVSTP